MSSIRRRLTDSVNSMRRMSADRSICARIVAHLQRRYFRLSRVVVPFGVSAQLLVELLVDRRAPCATASICFCT